MLSEITILKNPLKFYDWGSTRALQELLGETGLRERPVAEVWMGAHPDAPSQVLLEGKWVSLGKAIEQGPEFVLNNKVSKKFSGKLPFLFKVLAAERPLSIQAHPNKEQARRGFVREDSLGIPGHAPQRNYKDEHHKPELLCALEPFQGLKGFRPVEEILELMGKVSSSALSEELKRLRSDPGPGGLRRFFAALLRKGRDERVGLVTEAVRQAKSLVSQEPAVEWVIRLHDEHPGDVGVLSPLILNLFVLEPGEALYLAPGQLHAYLHGVGIEVMANSDNVLRGGLTTKHVDVEQLLRIVDFRSDSIIPLRPRMKRKGEMSYQTPAEEFLLSVISVVPDTPFTAPPDRSVEILICVQGGGEIKDSGTGSSLPLARGRSVIIPAAVPGYCIEGRATLYKASVPP